MKKQLLFLSVMAITFSHAQVSLVKDINPGIADGIPIYNNDVTKHIVYNNILLFAAENTSYGIELWRTDGTNIGTSLVKNISTISDSEPKGFYKWELTGNVYFSASNTISGGNSELWETDGTFPGTNSYGFELNDNGSSSPANFATIDGVSGRLLFSADYQRSSANTGIELCYADTSSSTNLLGQLNGENGGIDDDSSPSKFVLFNNELYFSASNGNGASNFGRELYKTNTLASGTTRMSDINPNNGDSNPENLIVFNNQLYFTANLPSIGNEIFKITTGGNITSLKNINPSSASSNAKDFIVYNNVLYFTADDGTNGRELWSTTGFSSTTNMLLNINPTSSSNATNFTIYNNKLYFSADDGINGVELWVTDGTSAGTILLKDINTSPATPDSNPSGFTEYFGELFFSANDGTNGIELWKTDGTNAGTVLVSDINTSGDSNPTDLIVAGDNLFFSATTTATGRELWKYIDPSLSVSDVELENSISLFPNPTKNSFSIETNTIIETIFIYDVQGKLMKSFTENLEVYNIEELTSGIYFVNITTEKGSATKKLIKD